MVRIFYKIIKSVPIFKIHVKKYSIMPKKRIMPTLKQGRKKYYLSGVKFDKLPMKRPLKSLI